MWNQSSGASIGALLQNLAQTNPRVLQQIMQIMQQRQQQGVGGIGSLPQPGSGGPMPMGGLWGMTGQQPTSPLPYGQRFNTTPDAPALARMPTSYDGGRTYQTETVDTGSKFYPPSGPKSYGTQGSYTAPTGPKSWGTPQPYTAPIGPKIYGQTMPAEQPPAFTAPSQPKVYNPMPVVGDGTTGLDWYAQQAGN